MNFEQATRPRKLAAMKKLGYTVMHIDDGMPLNLVTGFEAGGMRRFGVDLCGYLIATVGGIRLKQNVNLEVHDSNGTSLLQPDLDMIATMREGLHDDALAEFNTWLDSVAEELREQITITDKRSAALTVAYNALKS